MTDYGEYVADSEDEGLVVSNKGEHSEISEFSLAQRQSSIQSAETERLREYVLQQSNNGSNRPKPKPRWSQPKEQSSAIESFQPTPAERVKSRKRNFGNGSSATTSSPINTGSTETRNQSGVIEISDSEDELNVIEPKKKKQPLHNLLLSSPSNWQSSIGLPPNTSSSTGLIPPVAVLSSAGHIAETPSSSESSRKRAVGDIEADDAERPPTFFAPPSPENLDQLIPSASPPRPALPPPKKRRKSETPNLDAPSKVKAKARSKSEKEKVSGEGPAEMTKPKSKKKSSTKARKGDAHEYKSAEIILDSGDESQPAVYAAAGSSESTAHKSSERDVQQARPQTPQRADQRVRNSVPKDTDLDTSSSHGTKRPTPEMEDEDVDGLFTPKRDKIRRKHKSSKAAEADPRRSPSPSETRNIVASDDDSYPILSAKEKSKSKSKSKSRKTILSDVENEDEVIDLDAQKDTVPPVGTASSNDPAEKSKKKSKKKKKGRPVAADEPETHPKPGPGPSPRKTIAPLSPAKVTSISDDEVVPEDEPAKENIDPESPPKPVPMRYPSVSANYTIGRISTANTPMSELIRRASSKPSSPFPNVSSSRKAFRPPSMNSTSASASPRPGVSPFYGKNSKSALSRIAPLHLNRRTPPPPPPPPPPRKKSKKELEREEQWEEELMEELGGTDVWNLKDTPEKKVLKRAKFARELGMEEW